MTRTILITGALLLLAGCGNKQTLHPPQGASLPPKAATAPAAPTAAQLLTPPSATRPSRSDELLTKSQPRPDDPFDLPPK
jgi:ABC-type uncharacterized transport system auxiliary subunit